MDTPSSLDVQACLWTTYIHYCTITFLACTTPNGRFLGFPQFMKKDVHDTSILQISAYILCKTF